jgi:hypothetical protein
MIENAGYVMNPMTSCPLVFLTGLDIIVGSGKASFGAFQDWQEMM